MGLTAKQANEIILSLDPSTTRIGFALVSGPAIALVEVGRFTPSKRSAPWPDRVQSMISDVKETIKTHTPSRVILEAPDGKVHGNIAARSRGNGLSIYGAGFGAVWQACVEVMPAGSVELVPTSWTGGKPKKTRARMLAYKFPALDLSSDTGLDTADAIELAVWWWARNPQFADSRGGQR